ncbi:MAG: hypothetical protein JW754_03415 [Candidatus Aenigmarchaeota archaeon]|nr:hypothetical protein [Candidatus Aenigmarchaeota archaeon]
MEKNPVPESFEKSEIILLFPDDELTEIMDPEEILKLIKMLLKEDEDDDEKESYIIEILKKSGILEKYAELLSTNDPYGIMRIANEIKRIYIENENKEWAMSSSMVNEQSYTPAAEMSFEYQSRSEERDDVLNLKYEDPIFYNQQWTYQRLFIDNEKETSVYQLTMDSARKNGVEIEITEDINFGTKYVNSIDGIRDGENSKFWEYWVVDKTTGDKRIGEVSIDQQTLKKNEFIEWRLANEQEHGCGGGNGNQYDSFVMDYFGRDKPGYVSTKTMTPNFRTSFAY